MPGTGVHIDTLSCHVPDLVNLWQGLNRSAMGMTRPEEEEIPDDEKPETKGFPKGDPLGKFFNIATKVGKSCETMVLMTTLYGKAGTALCQAIDPDVEKEAQGDVDKIKGRAKDEIRGVKAVLDQMEKITKKQKQADDDEAKEAGNEDDPSWSTIYRVMYNCRCMFLLLDSLNPDEPSIPKP